MTGQISGATLVLKEEGNDVRSSKRSADHFRVIDNMSFRSLGYNSRQPGLI